MLPRPALWSPILLLLAALTFVDFGPKTLVEAEETNNFGDLRILSRDFGRQYIVEDPYTPIYGMKRTPCYPLNSTTSVYSRLNRNLKRAPELLLALLCCLCCLAWICAALAISFCFGQRYRCALCLRFGGFCKTCLHFGFCCFICHFCLNKTIKQDKCCEQKNRISAVNCCPEQDTICCMSMPSRTYTMDSSCSAPNSRQSILMS
uniref:Uncharacterized protein n=1 Tax=Cacopsylla melanoneura TaxID=428564 RepID=A0A8D9C002_9HEMI